MSGGIEGAYELIVLCVHQPAPLGKSPLFLIRKILRLDPVPSDARELTFTITKFGDWQGPWEFHIPLG